MKFYISLFFCLAFNIKLSLAQHKVETHNDSIKIDITKLGDEINSSFDDYAPVITADGHQMFFTSKRPFTEKEKKKNKESTENIYSTSLENEKWNNAVALPKNVNIEGRYNSNVAISNDGHKLLIYQDDEKGNGDIFECSLKGTDWSNPISLGDPINSSNHESSATISPDGKTIYFVSNRVGGAGQRDIWKCTKTLEGKWGKAENLGRTINTTMDEESIYIHPDGKTLYFSSKGHHSTGGYDVYRSTLVKGKWTKPINLGKPINTEADDLFFVLDASGKRGYYTSSASGNKDIYQIDFTPLKEEKIKQPLVTILKGIVIDEVSKKPLESTIEIVDNNTHELISKLNSNSASGKFLISLPSGHNYGINVSADGYLFHSENFELSDSSAYAEVSKQILMKKMEVGTTIVLRNIFFDVAKTTLRPSSVTELNRLIDIMVKNPNIQIEISGHTDNQGSDVYNQNLSEGRAKAVVDFLIEHKVDAARLTFKGYGESKPIDTNDTDAGKQNNRRTEFKILKI